MYDERTIVDSSGNGMAYFGEDSYLYYTSDKVIGRYGPFGGTKTFADDFLGAEGGVPLNTASIDFESSSSMYATAADSASLSITGTCSSCNFFSKSSISIFLFREFQNVSNLNLYIPHSSRKVYRVDPRWVMNPSVSLLYGELALLSYLLFS